jgi:hypothetical protein
MLHILYRVDNGRALQGRQQCADQPFPKIAAWLDRSAAPSLSARYAVDRPCGLDSLLLNPSPESVCVMKPEATPVSGASLGNMPTTPTTFKRGELVDALAGRTGAEARSRSRNGRGGEAAPIAARRAVTFYPSLILPERVRQGSV